MFFLQGRECFLVRVEKLAFIKVHVCLLKSCGSPVSSTGTASSWGANSGVQGGCWHCRVPKKVWKCARAGKR